MVDDIMSHPAVKVFKEREKEYAEFFVETVVEVCQKPAPSLEEGKRAEYVASRFEEEGLEDVQVDEVNNVIGRLSGESGTAYCSVSAHLDTVFPMDTDLTVTREGSILRGPGVGDNSSAVACLITLARIFKRWGGKLPIDIVFLANAGEEGLGNLIGIRHFFDSYVTREDVDLRGCLIFDGPLGFIANRGVASRRLEVTVQTEGGHSWKDFGKANAIAEMAQVIRQIYGLDVPDEPRTTYNVGTISGGTSVNTVAQKASMLLDMRSVCESSLGALVGQVEGIFGGIGNDSRVSWEVRGERPGGSLDPNHPLITMLMDLGKKQGMDLALRAGSTDANWPLSLGLPAVTTGLTTGGGTHTLEEWVDVSPADRALGWALTSLLGASTVLRSI